MLFRRQMISWVGRRSIGFVDVSSPLGLGAWVRNEPPPLLPATATPSILGDVHREHLCGDVDALSSVYGHEVLTSLGGWDARESRPRRSRAPTRRPRVVL